MKKSNKLQQRIDDLEKIKKVELEAKEKELKQAMSLIKDLMQEKATAQAPKDSHSAVLNPFAHKGDDIKKSRYGIGKTK
jgi:glutamyl-tRNA reductase